MPALRARLLVTVLLLCGSSGATAAQGFAERSTTSPAADRTRTELPVERLPVNGALTQNSITDMLQDRSGLMWFATLGGVNVYDGYSFRAITSDPRDPDSLSGVMVAKLLEDRDGEIWIGGFLGWLDRLDPRTGKISHLPRSLFGRTDRPAQFADVGLWQDPQGFMWIATNDGLHRYDPRTHKVLLHADARAGRKPLEQVREIVPAQGGGMWLGASDGLYRFDPRTGALERFRHDSKDERSLPTDSVTHLYVDPDGTLWIGTSAGLARRDADGRFTRFQHDAANPRSLGGNWVMGIRRDRFGNLWVASQGGGGLSLYRDGQFEVFRNDPDDPDSLSASDIWSLYEDRSGLLWLGSAGLGLNRLNSSTHRFHTLRAIPFNRNSLRNSFVWDMVEAADGEVWLATLGGLDAYDPKTANFRHFEPQPGEIGRNQLQSVHIDRAGRMWVGAVDGHLYRFDPASGKFTPVRFPGRQDDLFATDRVWHFGEGPDGRLWLSALDKLVALDPVTATVVEQIPADGRMPLGATAAIRSSLVDSDGVLWLGGGGAGLIRYEQGTGVTAILSPRPGEPESLSDNNVRSLYEAKDGTLWIGTQNGLNRMSAEDRRAGRNRVRLYARREGLPNNTVYGILPDGDGHLWVSTNRGISHFDTVAGKVIASYDSRDGLVGDEMNGGAELVARDGTLYFGGVNGVSWFKPGSLPFNRYVPQVRISAIDFNGRPRSDAGLAPPGAIELAHSDAGLTLSLAAMDFHQPSRNRFRYRIGDQAWIETENNTVSLAKLGAGQYRFEVLGSNNDGVWSREPARLDLTVRAPWWATREASIGYALAFVLLAFAYDRGQRRKLAREREFSEELADAHSLAEANHQLALRNAQYDSLTQLPNRATLLDALGRYMRFARAQGGELALLLINLDRFQRINDNLGHKLGDNVLKVTAERLQQVVDKDDLLARVGSDEFALVAMRPKDVDLDVWLTDTAARLQAAIGANHEQLDPALNLSAAIGIAHHDAALDGEDSATDLLGCANIALHSAKRDGSSRVRRYQSGMIESARERLAIEGRMHRALEAEEFVPFYQPLVDVKRRTLAGFEALIRWQPPGQAMIFPDQFIPVAEESGLIVEIGNLMIRQACRQLAIWKRWDIAIAVNVSMRHMRSGTLVGTIDRALRETGVPAHCLKLEITESAMMENVEDTAAQLRAIKQIGVRLSVDDFGTGFSSLSHLKMLPVDELKIDRSFVGDLVANKHSQKIVSSIVRLAHELQLSVVAEGVEEEGALTHLRGLGCDLAQGYLFDRPRPAAQLEERGWLGAQLPITAPASA